MCPFPHISNWRPVIWKQQLVAVCIVTMHTDHLTRVLFIICLSILSSFLLHYFPCLSLNICLLCTCPPLDFLYDWVIWHLSLSAAVSQLALVEKLQSLILTTLPWSPTLLFHLSMICSFNQSILPSGCFPVVVVVVFLLYFLAPFLIPLSSPSVSGPCLLCAHFCPWVPEILMWVVLTAPLFRQNEDSQ